MVRPIHRIIPSVQTSSENSFRTSIASALERATQVSSSTMQPHIWAQVSESSSESEELDYDLPSCPDVFINNDIHWDLPEEDEGAQDIDDAPVYGPYLPLEAEDAIAEFAEGKNIEQIANEHGMDEQDVLDLIEESDHTIDLSDESDLAIEESNPSSEIDVVEIMDGDGEVAIVVFDENGNATTLNPDQEASRESIDDILEGVYDGESIIEIAESQGLTREQIIAQLNAAGYELEILSDEAGNTTGIKIQDAQSGEEVASSSYDLKDGTRTSSFTDSKGNEFSQNESDSIEHVVQAGEYLILIAEYYGVTLEDLKRDNPEYFESPRDPDLIYPGETLTINGASTTTETTASGYTLTTHMDGSKTLHNTDGKQVEIEQGTFLDVIAEEFLAASMDSVDSETTKNTEVLQVIIDASLARSDVTSLEGDLEDIQTKIQENTLLLNQGLVDVEDYLHELKSEENEMLGALEELWLNAGQTQAQWNVFALDPDYEDAINDVDSSLDKAGWNWEPEKPEGTLEDAELRLDEVNSRINLVTANREWEQQEQALNDLQQLALDTAREDKRYAKYFDPDGYLYEVSHEGYTHSIVSVDETGGLIEQYVSYDETDRQLYLVNVYEEKEVNVQLTFFPDEAAEERSDAMQQLDQEWEELKYGEELAVFKGNPPEEHEANQAWQEFISNNDRGDGIIATDDSLFGASSNLLEAKQAFNETTVDIKADEINKILEDISALTQARDDAMDQYGEGTLVPYGNGEPQQIDIDEQHKDEWGHLDGRWVAPEVADAYETWVAASGRYDESEDIKQRVRDDFEEEFRNIFQNSHVFSFTGEGVEPEPITSYVTDEVIEKDGQLYLKITYEGGIEEIQLTFSSEEELPEWRGGERWSTDQEWAEWKENAQGGDITNYLDNSQDSYNQAKEAFEAALTTYGEGSEKKVTDSLPEDIEPVLMYIGDDQRWVHPEVAEAQLALDEGQLAFDKASLEKEQAQAATATTTHLLSSPSTWQLHDNDAGPTLDSEDSWWKSDDYLEQHNRVLQAQQSLADTQLMVNVNQQGLLNANINLIEKKFPELSELDTTKAEKDEWEEQERSLLDEIPESQVWLAAHEELAELQENREALEEYGNQIQHELNSNIFMLEQSEEDRIDDKQQGKIDQQYHDQHPEAAAYIMTEQREQLTELTGSEELHVSADSEDFKDYVNHALGTDEDEIVDSVIDEIVEIGGDQAKVEIVPILYLDPSDGERTTALFRVINENGTPYLVDESGKKYRNLDDYQDNNYLLEDGKLFIPRNLNNITDIDGVVDYEWRQARVRSNVEKVVDPIVGIGTTAATVAMFIPPLAPVAAPLAFAGGAYLGGRALDKQFNHLEHGGEWNDTESWMNYLSVATTAMPMGSSLLRTGGMLRTIDDISGWQAFQASIGGARLKSSNLFLARRTSASSPYSGRIEAYMQSRDWRNVIAYGADWSAIGTGVPLMGMSFNGLLANGGQMSNLEKWDAWLGFGTGFVGTGFGIHGLSMTRPTRKTSIVDQSKMPSVDQSLSERFFLEHEIYSKLLQLSPIFRSILQDPVKNHGVKIIVGERGAGSYYSPADNHIVIDLSLFSEHKAYRLALTLAEELSHSISNNKGLVNWALPGEEIKATPGRLLPLLSHEGQGLPLDSGAMRQAAVDSDVNALLQEEGAAYLTVLKIRDEFLKSGATVENDYIPSDRVKIYEQYRNGELSWYGATIALGDLIAKDRPSDAAPGETYRSAKMGQRENVWNRIVDTLSEDSLSATTLQPNEEVAFSFSSASPEQPDNQTGKLAKMSFTPTSDYQIPIIVFRGDSRSPEKIFVDSFSEEGQSLSYGGVSTSLLLTMAEKFPPNSGSTWVYKILTYTSFYALYTTFPNTSSQLPRRNKIEHSSEDLSTDILSSRQDYYELRVSPGDAVPLENIISAQQVSRGGSRKVLQNVDNPYFLNQEPHTKIIELADGEGEGSRFNAKVIGVPPESADKVHIIYEPPRAIGEVNSNLSPFDKTHIAIFAWETGESIVMPWIRGTSENQNGETWSAAAHDSGENEPKIRLPGFFQRLLNRRGTNLAEHTTESADTQSIQAVNREEFNLPHWVTDAELEAIKSLKALSPDEISALPDASLRNIEAWYLLLLSREQLQAWPSQSASQKSMEEWSANLRLSLLEKTANALLEPTVIRSRLPNVLDSTTPNHAEPIHVFRGDTRGPEEIFSSGFVSRNPSDANEGISTSLSARKAHWWANTRGDESGGWVYTIEAEVSDGEIFQSLPARPQHSDLPGRDADINNFEIRLNSIDGHNILAARRVDLEGNYAGPPIYNPNFRDASRLPRNYPGDPEPLPDDGSGPRSLSAAYLPEGAAYPEQPSPIPAVFRKSQQPDFSRIASNDPVGHLSKDLTAPLIRPTASSEQKTSFSSEQVVDFKPAQIRGISETQILAILPEHLAQIPPGRMTHFTPEQVAAFTKEQLAALTNDQVRKLTPRQLEALAPEQITAFTLDQLGVLRPKQISPLSGEQLSAFSARQLRNFSEIQIQAMQPDALVYIKPNRLMWLWPEQIASLKSEQVTALTPKQIASLTSGQIIALTDKQFMALSTDQWQALTLKQLRGLSDEQLQMAPQSVLERAARPGTISVILDADGPVILLHGVNKEALGTLVQLDRSSQAINEQDTVTIDRRTLEGFLNPRAKGLLPNGSQLCVQAANNAPVEQGRKFKKTAIASALIAAAAVGSILSFYPTANALAYAWRGASFVYRGYRQEATAAVKAQGRILRGVEFFTICINTPNAYKGLFDAPWVNGSYAFGNTVYGFKTFWETVTGKPQFPSADDLGLPAYLVGSTPSIYSNGAEIFAEENYALVGDLAAASLFGFGSVYLWKRDSLLWNQFLKHKFRPLGTSESFMGTELLPVEVEPAGVKRDIAFALTIGGGLLASSLDAFGFFDELGTSDSEPDDNPPSPEESSSEPSETPSSDQPDQPIEPTPVPTQTRFVVTVPEGLNLRSQPLEDADIVASFSYGAFVYSTGPQETDSEGNTWLPVIGTSADGNEHKGWVMARYLDEHAEGDMGENGRINPDLESQGHDWVEVERNDTLSSIAKDNDDSLDDVLALNDEHILDPDILYPGDRIYLPE